MKKAEKTERTKERILQAAMEEFGRKGYAAATIGAICSEHGIAKGLLYHNFVGKDDLYLACVSRCFDDVTAYLQGQNLGADLHRYMEYRFRYFSDHPLCAGLFFEAVLRPRRPRLCHSGTKESVRPTEPADLSRGAVRDEAAQGSHRSGGPWNTYAIMQEMFNGISAARLCRQSF